MAHRVILSLIYHIAILMSIKIAQIQKFLSLRFSLALLSSHAIVTLINERMASGRILFSYEIIP